MFYESIYLKKIKLHFYRLKYDYSTFYSSLYSEVYLQYLEIFKLYIWSKNAVASTDNVYFNLRKDLIFHI